MTGRIPLLCIGALSALFVTLAVAATAPDVAPALARFNAGQMREQYIAATLGELRQLDVDRDGLTSSDIDEAALAFRAQQRAGSLTRVFGSDLNNDGKVERAELTRALRRTLGGNVQYGPIDYIARQIDELMKADANGDGAIDFAEARAYQQPGQNSDFRTTRARELLALDPNKDGRLTVDELEALARKAFATVDTDADSVISLDEQQKFTKVAGKSVEAQQIAERVACRLPTPAPGHQFVVVGPAQGAAISSVSVVGQDETTELSRINIEAGTQPLDILLISGSPRLWQIAGATNRIAQVRIAASRAAGVTGVPRERVVFLPAGDCILQPGRSDEITIAAAKAALRLAAGREPDVVVTRSRIDTIALPSGTPNKAKPSRWSPFPVGRLALVDSLERFYPAGVVQVDQKSVIASGRVERYAVLPTQAGLLQLFDEGALEFIGGGIGLMKLKIVKPIKRFPAELTGAHAVVFVLAKGVPMPPGSPGHSCVLAEGNSAGMNDSPLCRL